MNHSQFHELKQVPQSYDYNPPHKMIASKEQPSLPSNQQYYNDLSDIALSKQGHIILKESVYIDKGFVSSQQGNSQSTNSYINNLSPPRNNSNNYSTITLHQHNFDVKKENRRNSNKSIHNFKNTDQRFHEELFFKNTNNLIKLIPQQNLAEKCLNQSASKVSVKFTKTCISSPKSMLKEQTSNFNSQFITNYSEKSELSRKNSNSSLLLGTQSRMPNIYPSNLFEQLMGKNEMIEHFKNEIIKISIDMKEKDQQCLEQKQQIQQLSRSIKEIQKQFDSYKHKDAFEADRKSPKRAVLQQYNEHLQGQNNRLFEQVQTMQSEMHSKIELIKFLEVQCKNHERTMKQLKISEDNLKNALEEKTAVTRALQAQNQAIQLELKNIKKMQDDDFKKLKVYQVEWKQKQKEKEKEICQQVQRLKLSFEKDMNIKNHQLFEIQSLLCKKQKQQEELENKGKLDRSEINILVIKLETTQTKLQYQSGQNQMLSSKIKGLEKRQCQMREKLLEQESQWQKGKSLSEEIKRIKQEHQQKVGELESQQKVHIQKCLESQHQIASLISIRQQLQIKNIQQKSEFEAKNKSIAEKFEVIQKQIADLTDKLHQANSQSKEKQKIIRKLENQYRKLENQWDLAIKKTDFDNLAMNFKVLKLQNSELAQKNMDSNNLLTCMKENYFNAIKQVKETKELNETIMNECLMVKSMMVQKIAVQNEEIRRQKLQILSLLEIQTAFKDNQDRVKTLQAGLQSMDQQNVQLREDCSIANKNLQAAKQLINQKQETNAIAYQQIAKLKTQKDEVINELVQIESELASLRWSVSRKSNALMNCHSHQASYNFDPAENINNIIHKQNQLLKVLTKEFQSTTFDELNEKLLVAGKKIERYAANESGEVHQTNQKAISLSLEEQDIQVDIIDQKENHLLANSELVLSKYIEILSLFNIEIHQDHQISHQLLMCQILNWKQMIEYLLEKSNQFSALEVKEKQEMEMECKMEESHNLLRNQLSELNQLHNETNDSLIKQSAKLLNHKMQLIAEINETNQNHSIIICTDPNSKIKRTSFFRSLAEDHNPPEIQMKVKQQVQFDDFASNEFFSIADEEYDELEVETKQLEQFHEHEQSISNQLDEIGKDQVFVDEEYGSTQNLTDL